MRGCLRKVEEVIAEDPLTRIASSDPTSPRKRGEVKRVYRCGFG